MYIVTVECPAGTRIGPGAFLEIVSDAIRKEMNKRNEITGRIKVAWSNESYDVPVCPEHGCRVED